MIKGVKPLLDDLVHLPQSKELLVADGGQNVTGHISDRAFIWKQK
jgi:hypothetical protein